MSAFVVLTVLSGNAPASDKSGNAVESIASREPLRSLSFHRGDWQQPFEESVCPRPAQEVVAVDSWHGEASGLTARWDIRQRPGDR